MHYMRLMYEDNEENEEMEANVECDICGDVVECVQEGWVDGRRMAIGHVVHVCKYCLENVNDSWTTCSNEPSY